MSKHGDGTKDIAFEVEDLDAIFKVVYSTQISNLFLPAAGFRIV